MMVLCMSLVLCTILTLSEAVPFNSSITAAPVSRGLCIRQIESAFLTLTGYSGEYVPQCHADGNFLPRQCWASSGHCWCVNLLTGEEIPETRTPLGSPPVDCGSYSIGDDNNFCPTGWSHNGIRCFMFFSSPLPFVKAEIFCRHERARLASVHSSEENLFLQGLTRGDTYVSTDTWIGGIDIPYFGWLWTDGSDIDYMNWSKSSEGYGYCLAMNHGETLDWYRNQCTTSLPFVCAKEIKHRT